MHTKNIALTVCCFLGSLAEPLAAPLGPRHPGYEAQRAVVKQSVLLNAVRSTRYRDLPRLDSAGLGGGRNFVEKLANGLRLFNLRKLAETFDVSGDVRNFPGFKLFHPFGTVAGVEYEALSVSGHAFTGMYENGGSGLIRLSLAGPSGFTPGAAVKLLVDGKPSQNFVAIHTLDGEPNRKFFEPTLSNIIPPPKNPVLRAAGLVLALVANPFERPVAGLSRVTRTGDMVANPLAPHRLFLVPPTEGVPIDGSQTDFRLQVGGIPAETILYQVFASATPEAAPVHIGRLRSTSEFVSSEFGDQELYFRHER